MFNNEFIGIEVNNQTTTFYVEWWIESDNEGSGKPIVTVEILKIMLNKDDITNKVSQGFYDGIEEYVRNN